MLAESIGFWFRDTDAATQNQITMYDESGAIVAEYSGSFLWLPVVLTTTSHPVRSVRVEVDGDSGFIVFDDTEACLLPDTGDSNYCLATDSCLGATATLLKRLS
ncbi:MAG: hypothetical protein ACI841_003279 [Planctomycetota bacterium]|jgi:hypothetical protein